MPQPNEPAAQQGPDTREMVQLFLEAIRRHLVRVVFTTLVFLLIGIGLTMLWPSKFESETQFILREARIISDASIMEDLEDIPLSKKLVSLDNELRSMRRVGAVLDELQWKEWLETAGRPSRRRALYLKVKSNMGVGMTADVTGGINATIAFQWTSAAKAADFVNRLRDSWIKAVLDGYRKGLEGEKERAEKLLLERQADYRDALEAVRTYEQDNDVPSLLSIEINNELKADTTSKLVEARASLESTVTEIEILRQKLKLLLPDLEMQVQPDTPEQLLAMQKLAKAQEKFAEVSLKYMPANRKFRDAKTDLEVAEKALVEAGGLPTELTEVNTNPEYLAIGLDLDAKEELEREMRALVTTYEEEVESIDNRLQRLPVVTMDLARLNSDVTTASELLAASRLQIQPLRDRVKVMRDANSAVGQAGGVVGTGSFEIIDVGLEPEKPVLPIGAVLLAVSLILGVGVGLMGPVVSELTRSSFGSVKEVNRVLGVPVLGAVDMILTTRDVRARSVQSALTITTMLLVLAALGTALYIYSFYPNVLPASVLRTLREVQLALT
jgi:uncharacterized protein involved in exopolysaccharide biosynthesis